MKKIGLIGGISWVSTIDYYKFINEGVNTKLGGLNFAECIIYSLNFGDIQAKNLPIIHIGVETAKAINKQGFKKVGLLGTKFTMEMDFYRNKLEEYGLEVLIPQKQETRDYIQHTIKEELGIGFINPATKKNYISIVKDLVENGAECIILGCTEIPMLISQNDFSTPIFDTTKIHSQAIIEYIVSEN